MSCHCEGDDTSSSSGNLTGGYKQGLSVHFHSAVVTLPNSPKGCLSRLSIPSSIDGYRESNTLISSADHPTVFPIEWKNLVVGSGSFSLVSSSKWTDSCTAS